MELLYKQDWSNEKTVAVKVKVLGASESSLDGTIIFRCKIGNLEDTFDLPEPLFRDRVKTRQQVEKDYSPVEDVLGSIQKVLGITVSKKAEATE